MSNIVKFGLRTPYDLHEKIQYDAKLLLRRRKENAEEQRLEEFEAFNFFVTAWHLYKDWLQGPSPNKPKFAQQKIEVAKSEFEEIKDVMRDIANGSKHFELNKPAKTAVGDREISSWYSYFFGPQFSINTSSFHFLMYELVQVILAYFDWIFDDSASIDIPPEIVKKLKKATELRMSRQQHTNPSN